MTRLVGTWNNKLVVIGIHMGGPQRVLFWWLLMAYGLITRRHWIK